MISGSIRKAVISLDRIVGALDTGCRLGEMLKIQNRHVLWDTHQIVIPAEHTKDAESRRIPFEPKARLAQLLKGRRFLGPKAFVFGTATGGYQGTIRTAWESLVLLAHGFEPTRTRARGRVNREQLAGIDLHCTTSGMRRLAAGWRAVWI
jgi:integrase